MTGVGLMEVMLGTGAVIVKALARVPVRRWNWSVPLSNAP